MTDAKTIAEGLTEAEVRVLLLPAGEHDLSVEVVLTLVDLGLLALTPTADGLAVRKHLEKNDD